MKPVDEYLSAEEWKEEAEKSGEKIHPLIYITLSKLMEDGKMTFGDAYRFLYRHGKLINIGGQSGETQPE